MKDLTPTDTTSEVARVLGEHQRWTEPANQATCTCGHVLRAIGHRLWPVTSNSDLWALQTAHQAEALVEAGLLRKPALEAMTPAQLAQEGRVLASQRAALIATGVDPAEVLVVLMPRDHGVAGLEVTPAVRRAAQALLVTEHGEHADMYEPRLGVARLILAGAFDGEEIARQLCEQTGPGAYHGPIPCEEHSLAVAVVRDVMLGDHQGVAARRDEIIGDGS